MKSKGFIRLAAAALGAQESLIDFVENEIIKEVKKQGKQKYLKRLSPTFETFQKKQAAQKAKTKNPSDHGYHAKLKSNYRKNRDLAIYKSFLFFQSNVKEAMIKIWPGSHPFYSDQTCSRYVLKCVERVQNRRQ